MTKNYIPFLLSLAFVANTSVSNESVSTTEQAPAAEVASAATDPASLTEPPTENVIEGKLEVTSYTCSHEQLIRRVEIEYEEPGLAIPCAVNYYKDTEAPGQMNTLWHAGNTEGYCEEKATNFVKQLEAWGWACKDS